MIVYTYSEARQNLASLLDRAVKEGEVRIKRKDGQVFVVKPQPRVDSPLDVEGVDLGITSAEIVQFTREGRERFG
ncbi:MAG: type II toxin-antitoxin system Phd/YefM family antitoxin [bacterium]